MSVVASDCLIMSVSHKQSREPVGQIVSTAKHRHLRRTWMESVPNYLVSAMSDRLPIELLQPILSNLDNFNDIKSLKACALACSAWLPWARRVLFRSLVLEPESDYEGVQDMLQRFPYLTGCVRHLTVYGALVKSGPRSLVGPAQICAQLTNVESFTLRRISFSTFPRSDPAIVPAFFASLSRVRKSAVHLTLERVRFEEGHQCARIISAFSHLASLCVNECGRIHGGIGTDFQALFPCVRPPSLHKLRVWHPYGPLQSYLPPSTTSNLHHLITRMSDSYYLEPLLHPNAFVTLKSLEYELNESGSCILGVSV